jgi:predicted metal-dependent hydrolase
MNAANLDISQFPAYTDAHLLAYPVEYIAGIDLYNAGEFHAAHDAWEDRWMGEVGPQEKLFLQAMIQSAVAFHHLQIGRPGAARQMHLRAKEKFEKLGKATFMSLDIADYLEQLERALSWLRGAPDPRDLIQPNIQPPTIRLIAEITDYD